MIRPSRRFLLLCVPLVLGVWTWHQSQWWPRRAKLSQGPVTFLAATRDGGLWTQIHDAKSDMVWLRLGENLQVRNAFYWKQWNQAQTQNKGNLDPGWQQAQRYHAGWTKDTAPPQLSPEHMGESQLSPDGRFFVCAWPARYSYGGDWQLFERIGKTWRERKTGKPQIIGGLFAFSPDSRILAIGNQHGDVAVVRVPSLQPSAVWRDLHDEGGNNYVGAIALSPDKNTFWTVHPGAVWERNIKTKATRKLAFSVPNPLYDPRLLVSPDGEFWVLDGRWVWNITENRLERELPAKASASSEVWSPDSRFLFVGDATGTITRWKLK